MREEASAARSADARGAEQRGANLNSVIDIKYPLNRRQMDTTDMKKLRQEQAEFEAEVNDMTEKTNKLIEEIRAVLDDINDIHHFDI